ncbi:CBS domain-containing protein [Chloroflexota bacterium]
MKIRDLLKMTDFENRVVVIVRQNQTVSEAVNKLIENNRGSLPVCNDTGELVGIITERDIVRKCFVHGGDLNNINIGDIMTEQVAICIPEDDLDYAIEVMKRKRIRHLPVVDNQKIVAMVSMRDLFGVQYEGAKAEIRYARLLPKRY